MGCLKALFFTCCGPRSCACCCFKCSPVQETTVTRLAYTAILFLFAIVGSVLLTPEIEEYLSKHVPFVNFTCVFITNEKCNEFFGYESVYNLFASLIVFHWFFMCFTIWIYTGRSWRARLHNGFWIPKIALLAGLATLSFYVHKFEEYLFVYRYVGLAGAGLFLIFQMYRIVEMAYSLGIKLSKKAAISHNKCWNLVLAVSCLIFFIIAVGGAFVLVLLFALPENCTLNRLFIGINIGGCIFLAILSLLPCAQHGDRWAGALPSSMISAYIMFVTWSALTNEPRELEEPWRGNLTANSTHPPTESSLLAYLEPSMGGANASRLCGPQSSQFADINETLVAYVGIFVTVVLTLFSSFTLSSESHKLGVRPNNPKSDVCRCCRTNLAQLDVGGQHVLYTESEQLKYSYAFFHFVYSLAALYILMQLTNWYRPEKASVHTFSSSWASVWVKLGSSWLCLFIYFITLVLPCARFWIPRHSSPSEFSSLDGVERDDRVHPKRGHRRNESRV